MEEEKSKLHFCETGYYGYKYFVGNKGIEKREKRREKDRGREQEVV